MNKVFYQQGDCLIFSVKSIPSSAKKIETNGKFTLLRGEGVNTHKLVGTDFEIYEDGETIYLKTNKEVKLEHSEHGIQTIAPNKIYKRVIEREWDYPSEESRRTLD